MKQEIIAMLSAGHTYREIVEALGCSKATISYHAQKNNLRPEENRAKFGTRGQRRCEFCGAYTKPGRKYCGQACVNKARGVPKPLGSHVVAWRQRNKLRAVEHMGGACVGCGYDTSVYSLVFHHVDPSTKSFTISQRGICRAWAVLVEELKKCILLCANCHGEVHDGIRHMDGTPKV